MLSILSSAAKVVGVKQSKKVIREGSAQQVFLALDADDRVAQPVRELCEQYHVAVTEVTSMKELGTAAGIAVGAAVVVVLKQ